ncbi:hypothetical protein [Methylomonas sp. MgM2]
MLEMFYQHGNFTVLGTFLKHNNNYERTIRMSIDENTNESENQNNTEESASSESLAPATEASSSAKNAAGNFLSTLLALKESNPKVFFGGIGAVVVVLLIVIMSGGSDKKLPVYQAKALVPGQSYALKNPNSYDPSATVRLVSVPGSMAAYDDTEEADREGGCKHMPQNTPVKLIQTQNDSTDRDMVWAEVEMTGSGECQGKRGWTSSVNLQ